MARYDGQKVFKNKWSGKGPDMRQGGWPDMGLAKSIEKRIVLQGSRYGTPVGGVEKCQQLPHCRRYRDTAASTKSLQMLDDYTKKEFVLELDSTRTKTA